MLIQSGESLDEEHYDELTLLIEAGIDTALVERLEKWEINYRNWRMK